MPTLIGREPDLGIVPGDEAAAGLSLLMAARQRRQAGDGRRVSPAAWSHDHDTQCP